MRTDSPRWYRLRDRLVRTTLVAVVATAGTAVALSGGFQLAEHSARGTGLGGALVASKGDPTALHLNPASLAFLSGTDFSFGTTVILPEQRFNGVMPDNTETRMQAQVLFPPNVYITHSFGRQWGLGVALTVPYAVRTEWNPDWVGKRLATKSDLRVAMLTPGFAVRVSDQLSLGAALNFSFPKILYEQRIPVSVPGDSTRFPDAYSTHEAGGSFDVGVQVGALYAPSDGVSIGASYRSPVRLRLDNGSVSYRDIPAAILPQYATGKFSTSIALPSQFHAGAAWQPARWLYAAADVEYSLWSELSSIEMDYTDPVRSTLLIDQRWQNTVNARFGLEFNFASFSLRGGYRVEQVPIPDRALTPGLPDADAVGYSLGFGYRAADGLLLDFAYLFLRYQDRVVSASGQPYDGTGAGFNGRYTARTTSIALNVRYSWE
ncbi:MAG: outer membrane protein transport protein [Bacteroidota bacterium]